MLLMTKQLLGDALEKRVKSFAKNRWEILGPEVDMPIDVHHLVPFMHCIKM